MAAVAAALTLPADLAAVLATAVLAADLAITALVIAALVLALHRPTVFAQMPRQLHAMG
mgnify:CR=1 FL=1